MAYLLGGGGLRSNGADGVRGAGEMGRCDFWKIDRFESQSAARGGMSGGRTRKSVQSAGGIVGFRWEEEVDREVRSGSGGRMRMRQKRAEIEGFEKARR